jgi:predicted Zn-dependent protease
MIPRSIEQWSSTVWRVRLIVLKEVVEEEEKMSQSRIDAFTAMLKDQPDNEMIWYGLANEYTKLENWPAATEALRNVIRIKPDYTSAYQMLGAALVKQGEPEEARRAWMEGIEAANRTGAWKARQHMEGLLAGLPAENEPGFCE